MKKMYSQWVTEMRTAKSFGTSNKNKLKKNENKNITSFLETKMHFLGGGVPSPFFWWLYLYRILVGFHTSPKAAGEPTSSKRRGIFSNRTRFFCFVRGATFVVFFLNRFLVPIRTQLTVWPLFLESNSMFFPLLLSFFLFPWKSKDLLCKVLAISVKRGPKRYVATKSSWCTFLVLGPKRNALMSCWTMYFLRS